MAANALKTSAAAIVVLLITGRFIESTLPSLAIRLETNIGGRFSQCRDYEIDMFSEIDAELSAPS